MNTAPLMSQKRWKWECSHQPRIAMPYNEQLAIRIRRALDGEGPVTERKMFGGLAFMFAGNMVCGVMGDEIMARVGLAL